MTLLPVSPGSSPPSDDTELVVESAGDGKMVCGRFVAKCLSSTLSDSVQWNADRSRVRQDVVFPGVALTFPQTEASLRESGRWSRREEHGFLDIPTGGQLTHFTFQS